METHWYYMFVTSKSCFWNTNTFIVLRKIVVNRMKISLLYQIIKNYTLGIWSINSVFQDCSKTTSRGGFQINNKIPAGPGEPLTYPCCFPVKKARWDDDRVYCMVWRRHHWHYDDGPEGHKFTKLFSLHINNGSYQKLVCLGEAAAVAVHRWEVRKGLESRSKLRFGDKMNGGD